MITALFINSKTEAFVQDFLSVVKKISFPAKKQIEAELRKTGDWKKEVAFGKKWKAGNFENTTIESQEGRVKTFNWTAPLFLSKG